MYHETFWILAHYPLRQEAQSNSQKSFQLQTFPAVICCSFITSWSSSYTWFGSPNCAPSSIPWSLLQYPRGFKQTDWFHWVMCAQLGLFHLFWWSLIILKADSWHDLQKAEEFIQHRHILFDLCFSLTSACPVKLCQREVLLFWCTILLFVLMLLPWFNPQQGGSIQQPSPNTATPPQWAGGKNQKSEKAHKLR